MPAHLDPDAIAAIGDLWRQHPSAAAADIAGAAARRLGRPIERGTALRHRPAGLPPLTPGAKSRGAIADAPAPRPACRVDASEIERWIREAKVIRRRLGIGRRKPCAS